MINQDSADGLEKTSLLKSFKIGDLEGVELVVRPWGEGNNPKIVVAEFLKTNFDIEVDHAIDEKLLISVAPGGYLERVK